MPYRFWGLLDSCLAANDSEKNLYNFLSLVDFPPQNTSETM